MGAYSSHISRKIYTEDIPRTLLNEDDLAVTANGVANIQNQLIEWKDIFSRHRLRVSLEKTEVMWWDIEGKSCKYTWMEAKQRNSFVYLDGVICGVGDLPVSTRKNPWDVAWTLAWVPNGGLK